jgi:hypothetical protein
VLVHGDAREGCERAIGGRYEALAKLISVRHHCFVLGVLKRGPMWQSYRQAFRVVNRLCIELRDAPEGQKPHTKRHSAKRREISPLIGPSQGDPATLGLLLSLVL